MIPVRGQVDFQGVEDWYHVSSFSHHTHCKGEREGGREKREGGGRERRERERGEEEREGEWVN